MPVRVLLIEPRELIRQAIRHSLPEGYKIVAESGSSQTLIRSLMDLRPDVLVCSSTFPAADALVELRCALATLPDLKVLMLIDGDGSEAIAQFVKCGVRGLVSKNAGAEDVREAISQVGGGGQYFCNEATEAVVKHMRKPDAEVRLSPRESDVLRLINNGLQTKAIAIALGIRESSARGYRKSLMKRVGASNAVELIHGAKRLGLID